ncbi:MAG: hypothetical protein KatS3mg082_1470 [Nitrospiraceae bacterium]|nr:MAG: hypothetical protein KatS3mg082_1470 [Nitrospiraceae bacterium]
MRRLDIRRIYPVADMERPAIFGVLGVQKLNPALPEPLADLAAHVLASAAGNTMAILARMRDHLTGLPTRGLFENRLALLLHEAIAGRALSVLMIDIDRFKATNDTYGHLVGDKVLKTVAATIQRNVRRIEDTCRYGGEEIVVVLQEPIEVAQKVAERIRGEVAKLRVPPVRRITVSIGVAQWRAGMTARDVLAEADANLYRAKEGGRNRVVVSTKKGGDQMKRLFWVACALLLAACASREVATDTPEGGNLGRDRAAVRPRVDGDSGHRGPPDTGEGEGPQRRRSGFGSRRRWARAYMASLDERECLRPRAIRGRVDPRVFPA